MSSSAQAGVPQQQIRFCRAAGGTRTAYAVHGRGPPLVTFIQFDERGHGLSDRDVADDSLEARVSDLGAVVATGASPLPALG